MALLFLSITRDRKTLEIKSSSGIKHAVSADEIKIAEADTALDVYGRRLYAALFPPDSDLRAWLEDLPYREALFLHLTHEDLLFIPWEALHDGEEFLVQRLSLVRIPPKVRTPRPTLPQDALPFLFLPADPFIQENRPRPYRLSLQEEWTDIRRTVEQAGREVHLRRVLPPTLKALQDALAGQKGALVHFTGHGTRDDKGRVALLFETPAGYSDPVTPRKFVGRALGHAFLVFLSACQSAAPGQSLEANLAAFLVREGIPYAVGMQAPVGDRAARTLATTFYHHLLAGESILDAFYQARLALADADPDQAFIPVLYAAAADLPQHLDIPGGHAQVDDGLPQVDIGPLSEAPHGFYDRQRDLSYIGGLLIADFRPPQGGYHPHVITLHGPGGIGKTALLVEVARSFSWAFPDGVIGISFDPLLTKTPITLLQLLERFENFLDISTPTKDKVIEERINQLKRYLQDRRVLIVLDHIDPVVRSKNTDRDVISREIFEFLEQLPVLGPVLLISSREITNLPGEKIVSLSGIMEDDAIQMAHIIIKYRRYQAYSDEYVDEIRSLVNAIEGHPLALILLSTMFEDGRIPSLLDIVCNLEEYLQIASRSDNLGRRHDTLKQNFADSLNYWVNRDPSVGADMAKLSLFTGEFTYSIVNAIYDKRSTHSDKNGRQRIEDRLYMLWQRGLLVRRVEPVSDRESLIFYRVPTVLRPFAKTHISESELKTAKLRYISTMADLCVDVYTKMRDKTIQREPILHKIASATLPDMSRVPYTYYKNGGDIVSAMSMYEKVLYISRSLGDTKEEAIALNGLGKILFETGDKIRGILHLLEAFHMLQETNVAPHVQATMIPDLIRSRRQVEAEIFDTLWAQTSNGKPLPPWLSDEILKI